MRHQLLKGVILTIAALNAPLLFNQLYRMDWYRGVLLDCIDGLMLPKNTKVLDLGCGPGNLSHHLSRCGMRVVGADTSVKMLRRASKANTDVEFVQADAMNLPMPDSEFDFVLLASLINVVPDRTKVLREARRVLRPKGQTSVLFPTPEFDAVTAERIAMERSLSPVSTAAMSAWATASKKLEVSQICEEFGKAGYKNISSDCFLDQNVAAVTASKPRD